MSVICCKVEKNKIEIASDSITVRGWTQSKGDNVNHSKLTKVNNMFIGATGYVEESAMFFNYCSTRKPKQPDYDSLLTFLVEFAEWKRKKINNHSIDNSYIIIFEKKAFKISEFLIQEIKTYEAIGAGMDYALSALYLGHGVEKAVETACELCIYCEKPVVKYMVEK